jgi:serine/threonine protein kinase
MATISSPILAGYRIDSTVGSGGYAIVYRGHHILTGCPVALKAMVRDATAVSTMACIEREVLAMKSLDHPFIVPLYDVFKEGNYLYLVTEFINNGTLLDLINKTHGIAEPIASHIFYELIIALKYLHDEKHTCHRDVKPENILIDGSGHIRLADFGFAKVYDDDGVMRTSLGSPAYVSPEIIQNRGYTSAADIWSAGVLLFAMVTGYLPFQSNSTTGLLNTILENEPEFSPSLSPSFTDLVQGLLQKDPTSRLTISQILTHPWIETVVLPDDTEWLMRMKVMEVNSLDDAIVGQMKALQIETTGLLNAMNQGEIGEMTAVYKMLKRERITEELVIWQAQRERTLTNVKGRRVPLAEHPVLARSYETQHARLACPLSLRRSAKDCIVPGRPYPILYTFGGMKTVIPRKLMNKKRPQTPNARS